MYISVFLLTIATIIWGMGFVATRFAFFLYDPYWTNALRFLVAGGLGLPFLFYKKTFTAKEAPLKEGLIGGSLLFLMLLTQTIGLKYTTIYKSGFITTLYAPFVPIMMILFFKKRYKRTFILPLLMAVVGMAFLCDLKLDDFNVGDFLTFVCAVIASIHIIYIDYVAKRVRSPIEFNFIQNVVIGILSIMTAFAVKGPIDLFTLFDLKNKAVLGVYFLGIFASMIAFSIMVVIQKKMPPHIASLIYLLESPFAALFGFIIFNEKLSEQNIFGAGLILLAVAFIPILGREVTAQVKKGRPL